MRSCLYLWCAIAAMTLVDVTITPKIHEANPYAALAIARLGLPVAVALRVGMVIFGYVMFRVAWKRNPVFAGVMLGGTLAGSLVAYGCVLCA
jgi:hypothetical protein